MTAKPTRKQQTRRRRRAVFILLFAAVLCGVGFYCVSVFCRATHIEVTGSTRYAAEDIIEAADIGEEQNIFTISQKALNERITALCPYIECVTLHRRLPDTLELELHEFNTIYACIGSMGRVTTLSADGKVLEQCASLPEYTCLLLGADFSGYTAGEKLPEEWQKTLAGVDKVRAALEDAGMLPEIGYIEIGEEQSYKAVYQDRIQLRLGSEYDLATKLLTATSLRLGQFLISERLHSTVAARMGSTAFLAPCAAMVPLSLFPPVIRNPRINGIAPPCICPWAFGGILCLYGILGEKTGLTAYFL